MQFGETVTHVERAIINGYQIQWDDSVRHLGNYVAMDISGDIDCKIKCSSFIGSMEMYSIMCCVIYSMFIALPFSCQWFSNFGLPRVFLTVVLIEG